MSFLVSETLTDALKNIFSFDYLIYSKASNKQKRVMMNSLAPSLFKIGISGSKFTEDALKILKKPANSWERLNMINQVLFNLEIGREAREVIGRTINDENYTISRIAENGACDWCRNSQVQERMPYEDFRWSGGKFGKHENCKCKISVYDPNGNIVRSY